MEPGILGIFHCNTVFLFIIEEVVIEKQSVQTHPETLCIRSIVMVCAFGGGGIGNVIALTSKPKCT